MVSAYAKSTAADSGCSPVNIAGTRAGGVSAFGLVPTTPAQVVTVGLGIRDGRNGFPGVPFLSLPTLAKVSELDGTVIFVNEAHTVPTRHPAFIILHNPPPTREQYRAFAVEGTRELTGIVTSGYAAALWSAYLDVDIATISVVYPFAEPGFAAQPRPGRGAGKTRVLFAGRLSPEKGIYTLLATLHIDVIEQNRGLTFTATTAGADKPQGKIIERLLRAHPAISVVVSCRTPAAMARPLPIPPAVIVRQLEELIAAPSAEVTRTPRPGGGLTETAP